MDMLKRIEELDSKLKSLEKHKSETDSFLSPRKNRCVTVIQSNLSRPNPRRTAPIIRFSEVFGFPSVGFLVLCA